MTPDTATRALVTEGGAIVCARLTLADTPLTRLRGLLGRPSLAPDEGLLLRPAGSVHTAFMRFSIDVVFLDRAMRVLDVRTGVAPWRIVGSRDAKAVLELAAGAAARRGLEPAMALSLERAD